MAVFRHNDTDLPSSRGLAFVNPHASVRSHNTEHQKQARSNVINVEEANKIVSHAAARLQPTFAAIDLQTQRHLRKVLCAMKSERVSNSTFLSADGYGHSDFGRDALDSVYASTFSADSALVRIQFLSGTHAIASVLYGVLRPGDEVLCVAGAPYDTLEEVLGIRSAIANNNGSNNGCSDDDNLGSLKNFGISTRIHALLPDGTVDLEGLPDAIEPSRTKVVFIQRSFGYSWRPPLSISDIKAIVHAVRTVNADIVTFVDNCYGEFVDDIEPIHPSVGADVMAGSLIKNLGGGLVPSGAYVAGRCDVVRKARARFAAPGVGGGATLGYLRCMFQGLFMAPGVVGEALKGSLLVAEVMSDLGYDVMPARTTRSFVRAVKLGDQAKLEAFCESVQRNGPVGAFIQPTVGETEGYGDQVVFAQGTFIDGSTIELSADGPVRAPFAVFAQGGLHWTHWGIVLEDVVQLVGYRN